MKRPEIADRSKIAPYGINCAFRKDLIDCCSESFSRTKPFMVKMVIRKTAMKEMFILHFSRNAPDYFERKRRPFGQLLKPTLWQAGAADLDGAVHTHGFNEVNEVVFSLHATALVFERLFSLSDNMKALIFSSVSGQIRPPERNRSTRRPFLIAFIPNLKAPVPVSAMKASISSRSFVLINHHIHAIACIINTRYNVHTLFRVRDKNQS